MAELACAYAV